MNSVFVYTFSLTLSLILCHVVQYVDKLFRVDANKLSNLFGAMIIAFPVVLVMSVRYGLGTDYFNYEHIFAYYERYSFTRLEMGFTCIMDFVIWLSGEYQLLIVFTSILTVLLPVYAIVSESKKYIWLQFLILFCLYFGLWCAAIRQAVAIGFVALAINAIMKKKIFPYLAFVTVAGLFHSSAFVLYPLFLFVFFSANSIEKQKWKLVFAVALSFAFAVFFLQLGQSLDVLYSGYITSTREGGRLWIYFFLSLFLYVPEFFCFKKMCLLNDKNFMLYVMLIFEFAFFLLSLKVAHAFRMGFYFSLAHVFLIPQMLQINLDRNAQFLLKCYYIFFLILHFYITTYVFKLNGISVYDVFYLH